MTGGKRTRGIWVAAAALTLAATAGACSSDDTGSDAGTTTSSVGASVFKDNCASCHAIDGSGGQGPAIGDGAAAAKFDHEEMVGIVTNGRGAMPSFEGKLSADEVAAVVDYVREDLGHDQGATTATEPASTERGDLSGLPPELQAGLAGGDWPTANGDLAGSRALVDDAPIDSTTVDDLELAWSAEVPGGNTFGNLTTTPLVIGDTVYVGDLNTKVHTFDRATGEERFVVGDGASIFGPTGVAVGYDRIYGTRADAAGRGSVLVAYDADDGTELWATDLGENGGDINVQPVVYDGLVLASTSGYGSGTNATIYAVDAETGAIVWDFPIIVDPDIWGNDQNSGGGAWYPASIDTERRIAYFGTGNPYPFPGAAGFPNGESRPGDNRWTDSTLAIDLDTGKLAWGFQHLAHDIFDRDAMLALRTDVEIDGEARSITIGTGKLGVVTALDADSGEVIWRTPVGKHENDELTAIDGPTLVYPGSLGGVQTPLAIADGTIYACVVNAPTEYEGPEETSFGFGVQLGTANSEFVAIDAATGEIEWDVELDGDAFGGATVSGDLVFTSTFGGEVLALDRTTGETVWSYDAPGAINGWPAIAGDELYVPVGMGDTPQLLKFELPED